MTMDPVPLLKDLIRCASVTPNEGGALDLLEKLFKKNGFECHRLVFSEASTPDVDNLYARWGKGTPHICFAGHTDVVPTGDVNLWTHGPFSGDTADGHVWGRGAVDMKGGVAAFAVAALNFIAANKNSAKGSISFLITGDEEGPAINGTRKVLEWLDTKGEKIDFCIVGEPTSRESLGDMMKIGRRGSLTGYITVEGKQGHVAYPHLADNPVSKLLKLLSALDALELDKGTRHFQPSNLEVVNVHVGNTADNVIPAGAKATVNVRFNDSYTGAKLEALLRQTLDAQKIPYDMQVKVSGESFYTPPGRYSDMIGKAVENVTGVKPELSTTGGTSDARFIKAYCPVVEFGGVGRLAHQVDERVEVEELRGLARIYRHVLDEFLVS